MAWRKRFSRNFHLTKPAFKGVGAEGMSILRIFFGRCTRFFYWFFYFYFTDLLYMLLMNLHPKWYKICFSIFFYLFNYPKNSDEKVSWRKYYSFNNTVIRRTVRPMSMVLRQISLTRIISYCLGQFITKIIFF